MKKDHDDKLKKYGRLEYRTPVLRLPLSSPKKGGELENGLRKPKPHPPHILPKPRVRLLDYIRILNFNIC